MPSLPRKRVTRKGRSMSGGKLLTPKKKTGGRKGGIKLPRKPKAY